MRALAQHGEAARPAVPWLVDLLDTIHRRDARDALEALARVDPQAAAAISSLPRGV